MSHININSEVKKEKVNLMLIIIVVVLQIYPPLLLMWADNEFGIVSGNGSMFYFLF